MLDKFLLAIFITSLGSISVLTPKAIAQEPPECYIVDETGELEDLTDICNASSRRSPDSTTTEGENVVNNNINIVNSDSDVNTEVSANDGFVVGAETNAGDSRIDSSYLIDNGPGLDYTAYVRRYRASPNSFDILTRRESVFQFDRHDRSLTSILRDGRSELPFFIYRYQN